MLEQWEMLVSSSHLPMCFAAGCCWLLVLTQTWPATEAKSHSTFLHLRVLIGGVAWTTRLYPVSFNSFHLVEPEIYRQSLSMGSPCLGYTVTRTRFLRIFYYYWWICKLKLFSKNKKEAKGLHGILNHNMPSCWLDNISVDFVSKVVSTPNDLTCVEIL